MLTRRDFIKWCAATGAWVYVGGLSGCARVVTPPVSQAGPPLVPDSIGKFSTPLLIPPAMPRAGEADGADYYE
ncbi:twin-arginine translocation signal domain-containing protein, partial [bacterium]|nr:twin-arginine translocation signal domain-containing protein [bacterium]